MARRRVGITQRQTVIGSRDEVRDALDARLAALLWTIGLCPVPLANAVPDVPEYLDATGIEALVLSGGDDVGVTPQRDRFELAVLEHAEAHLLPVFGICRGLQQINSYAGGSLRPIEGHIATRHALHGDEVPPGRTVNSFHASAITEESLGERLAVVAFAPDGTIEAVRHRQLPWMGIMWHPEREDALDRDDARWLGQMLGSGEYA